MVKKARKN